MCNFFNAFKYQFADVKIEGADGAREFCFLRNDVEGSADVYFCDTYNSGCDWFNIARDNGLQCADNLRCCGDGIDGGVRSSAMPALASKFDMKLFCACHHGAGCNIDPAKLPVVPKMH